MSISKTWLACLASVVIAWAQIVVSAESNCDDNSKLQYEVGKSYSYKIHLVTYAAHHNPSHHGHKSHPNQHPHHEVHKFEGPKHETPKTKGKITTGGKIVVTALENCELVMTLANVTQEIQVDRDFTNVPITTRTHALPRTSVKFTFKNGEVSGLQGGQSGREPWSDNIIRGILTMIQNKAMSNADGEPEERETNIKGDCISKVYIPKEGTYNKQIHSGQCSDAIVSPMAEGVPYTTPIYSPVAGLRHSKSVIKCFQRVEGGVLAYINCTETDENHHSHHIRHKMNSLSNIQVIKTEMGKEPGSVGGATKDEILTLNQTMSIVYDMGHNILGEGDNLFREISSLAKVIYEDRDANKAELYLKLRDMLASVKDFGQLEKALRRELRRGDDLEIQFVKNIVDHAATEIGSEAAVVYLAKLIDNGTLEDASLLNFYSKLPFSREPTVKGLGALVGIAERAYSLYQNDTFITFHFTEKKKIRKMMLGTSAYAYQFCRRHADCGGVTEYQELINTISKFCNSKQPEISPACLHALGNVGHLPRNAVDAIKDILLSGPELVTGNNKKVTAFDAFRRDPCQPELKTLARENMENVQNPQDLRIVAYLAVARCVQEDDLPSIDKVLENEFDSPLSSFIASHVYNIMDSQSPSKDYLKNTALGQIGIPSNVPSAHNRSTASRFYEYSTFRPESNFGFSVDGHIIFMDDGKNLPLFAHFNLTLDVMGKSYNNLQLGLSKRYIPSDEKLKFFMRHKKAKQWLGASSMIAAFFSVDSYYRTFGTTISMGVDVFDTMKPHEFFDRLEDKETGLMKLDLVKPFTFLEKEVVLPTIAGTPVSVNVQAGYLPIISMNHTGDPSGLGFKDLFTKGQFEHNTTTNSALYAKVSLAAGKGTPLSMAYNLEAKLHCNQSIGYQAIQNMTSNWMVTKRMEFPEHTIWSKRLTVARTFTMESGNELVTKWPIYGEMKTEIPRRLFQYQGMGLKFTGDMLKQHHVLDTDILLKVEKTEDNFKGYSLKVEGATEGHARTYEATLSAEGLSTEDALHLRLERAEVWAEALKNSGDRPKSSFSFLAEHTTKNAPPRGFNVTYNSIGFPKSELEARTQGGSEYEVATLLSAVSLGTLKRASYSLKLDSWCHNNKMPLLDWSINNEVLNNVEATLQFEGPLKQKVGTFSGKVSIPRPTQSNEVSSSDQPTPDQGIAVSVELSHTTESAGENKVTADFAYADGDIQLNTSATIRGKSYHLTQHIPKYEKEETLDADGVSIVTFKGARRYNVHYHDDSKQEINLIAGVDENVQQTFVLHNASLRVTGPKIPVPLVVEASSRREMDRTLTKVHNGLLSWTGTVYVDAFGHKQVELKYDHKHTEKKMNDDVKACNGRFIYGDDGNQICASGSITTSFIISDKIDLRANFSNEDPYISEFGASFHHVHPDYSGDIKVITESPEGSHRLRWVQTKTAHLSGYPHPQDKWTHTEKTEVDIENRTLAHNSVLSNTNPQKMEWTTKVDGNWPENIFNGDINFKVSHTCPRKTTVTVDILNHAQSGPVFNNTLTALIDVTGITRDLKPKKQFTWTITAQDGRSEEEMKTHEYGVKSTNDMKFEILTTQPEEVFHMADDFQLLKTMNKEAWSANGHGQVFVHGKEVSAWDWDMDFLIGDKTVGENEIATREDKPASKSTFKFRGDGWFSSDQPAIRNNTWSSRFSSQASFDKQMCVVQDYTFTFRKIDPAVMTPMLSVDVVGEKSMHIKDLLHFSQHENDTIKVNNVTTHVVKDIVVNGPHITFFLKTDNGDEDSFVLDFAGGIYQEKHQHKFNLQSGSKYRHDKHLQNSKPANGTKYAPGQYHRRAQHLIPISNFNLTISK